MQGWMKRENAECTYVERQRTYVHECAIMVGCLRKQRYVLRNSSFIAERMNKSRCKTNAISFYAYLSEREPSNLCLCARRYVV